MLPPPPPGSTTPRPCPVPTTVPGSTTPPPCPIPTTPPPPPCRLHRRSLASTTARRPRSREQPRPPHPRLLTRRRLLTFSSTSPAPRQQRCLLETTALTTTPKPPRCGLHARSQRPQVCSRLLEPGSSSRCGLHAVSTRQVPTTSPPGPCLPVHTAEIVNGEASRALPPRQHGVAAFPSPPSPRFQRWLPEDAALPGVSSCTTAAS
ncbi:hypothetical protein HETIRDRAFT_481087 [Heterobasidion irregulare TC 32-1]|uniref:Uncharacterized protein n=1 Tax=Heterobasidion irregulare (strain TC 32-1) TaxID=747525 RepID=W4JVS6_HETIT|nr:uncharacterized protein HETIRDRAFT_481087 [Heterobasidion irregulare TC 32-1]ETW76966.1 hypothetical protein HETIRDRAFT_481087 [Heterobasidion irregulare TC 32-1]